MLKCADESNKPCEEKCVNRAICELDSIFVFRIESIMGATKDCIVGEYIIV